MLLPGDMYAIEVHSGVFNRYAPSGIATGLAVVMPNPYKPGTMYYEHGRDMHEIKEEYRRKLDIAQLSAKAEAIKKESARAVRLIVRIVKNSPVSFADARAVGYCRAGIESFCNRFGYSFSETGSIQFGDLAKHPEYASKLIADRADKLYNFMTSRHGR